MKMSTTSRVRSQGVLSEEIVRKQVMQKLRRICCMIVFTFNCLLFSVCSILLVASVMLSIYAKSGVPNTSIAIDRSIAKVLWVDRMALKKN